MVGLNKLKKKDFIWFNFETSQFSCGTSDLGMFNLYVQGCLGDGEFALW